MTETTTLAQSIDALADVAAEAGLDPAAARDEGLRVAAALAEAVPDAAHGWAAAAGLGTADLATVNTAFFEAASKGRRWRANPTELLEGLAATRHSLAGDYAEALTEVASAAVMLGTAPIWVIANATAASGVYLTAARAPHPSSVHSVPPAPPSSVHSVPPATLDVRGLPQLPPGPGTDAVLRAWGLGSPDPAGTGADNGSELSGIRHGVNPGAAQAESIEQPPAEQAPEPAEPEPTVEELLAELDAMIGLGRVKKEIHRQVALLTVEKMRVDAGLKQTKLSRHLIFVGNPGTGKTTVARLIGAIYKALGLLPKGQLIEVDRSELVAGYVGQTAIKTAEVCATAVGGVLFIDEAYALTGDQYAQEAVNTLVKEMEDHREDLVVIVAGYPEPMVGFIGQNPGLASRFTTTIEFDDYTDDELMRILDSIATGADYELTDEAERRVRMTFEATPRTPAFGNGRFSRNLFEHAIGRHAWRLKDATDPTVDELRLLTADDFIEHPDETAPETATETMPEPPTPQSSARPVPAAPPTPQTAPETDPEDQGSAPGSLREGPDGAASDATTGSSDEPAPAPPDGRGTHDEPDPAPEEPT